VALDKALGLSVSNHPVEEVQGVLFVDGVSCDSDPIDHNRHERKDESRGNGEVEIGGEGEHGSTDSCTEDGKVPSCTESPVEMSGNAGVNALIKLDLMVIDFPHFLLAPQELQSQQFSVVILGVRKRLH
jgi:hypothetical protein